MVLLRCRAEGVRGSSLTPDDGVTLTAFLKISSVEMGSLWDLMTPNTIFRASKVACFGHASRRCAVISTGGESELVNGDVPSPRSGQEPWEASLA